MIFHLFRFECWYLLRKPATYAEILLFFLSGLFMGSLRHLPYPDVFRNAPYFITYFTGLATLGTIFTITIKVAQGFLKDTETKIDSIVFAMPIRKFVYLFAPIAAVFTLTFLTVSITISGFLIGNYLPGLPTSERGPFSLLSYLWPLLVLAVPNILLCLSLTACIAWLSRNTLSVYIAGLLIYVLYLIGSIFSNSPLMAGASPATPEAMALTAKLDPFGLAAFFEQTRYWTVAERNSMLLELKGNFLVNRLLVLGISFAVLLFTYLKFSFRKLKTETSKRKIATEKAVPGQKVYRSVAVSSDLFQYQIKSILSLVQMDLRVVVTGLPFLLLLFIWTGLLAFEITNAIDGGVRMAALYANTSLMVSKIVEILPFMGSLILLFYSNELLWKSKNVNFLALTSTNPVRDSSLYVAKFISLAMIGFGLICWSIGIGIVFQFIYDFPVIEFPVYSILFYFVGLPFLLLIILMLFLQNLICNKFGALGICTFVLLLVNSKLGLMLAIKHPLLRFANIIDLPFSEMNGFGNYTTAFHWQMLQEGSLALVLFLITIFLWNRNLETSFLYRIRKLKLSSKSQFLIGFSFLITLISGGFISYQTNSGNVMLSGDELFDWRQNYEQKYKPFEKLTQPQIVAVKTKIDLFPSGGFYQVQGTYKLVNKSCKRLDTLLLYLDPNIQLTSFRLANSTPIQEDKIFRHSFYRLNKSLLPDDTLLVHFQFESSWLPFQPHNPTNAVLANGSFIRISRYFPKFGYQADNEIDNVKERAERKLPKPEPLKPVNSPEIDPCQFIQLDAIVSTEAGQIALGSGELISSWKTKDRTYFHYKTDKPIPFRFAFSSACYKLKKARYNGIGIEVYYDERHSQNVERLLKNAKATLAYAEANFGPYPHRTIRFAEISSFATGFAATAYPNIIYAKENQGFHADLRRSDEQDVINQLAGHELAHLWWGSAQVNPDVREGHSLMTETLAQYTELMLYRQAHSQKKSLKLVKTHLDLYLSGRGYAPEVSLYKAGLESPYLVYNKGMVVMYQLEQLIGEAQLNKALSLFFKNHAFPNPSPISSDLLGCFYKVSPLAIHPKIDALFKEIITSDAKLETANLKELSNHKYEVSFSGRVQKFKTNEKGRKIKVANDPQIEVGIETADGQLQVGTFLIKNGTVSGKILAAKKPTQIILDPLLKNLEISMQDNSLPL
jgi:ABC-2 type transport system permease protein